MITWAMQALPVIFYHQLPVAGFNNIFLAGYFGFGQFVWSEIRSKHGAHRLDISWCGRSQAYIDKTTDHSDFYWIQSEIFLWKVGIHPAGMQQISVKVVSPVVVRTDQPAAIAFLSGNQFMAAVTTSIVKSPHFTLFRSLKK